MNFFGMHRTSEKVHFSFFFFPSLSSSLYLSSLSFLFFSNTMFCRSKSASAFSQLTRGATRWKIQYWKRQKNRWIFDLSYPTIVARRFTVSSSLLLSLPPPRFVSIKPPNVITVWRTKKSTTRETKRKQERSINERRIFKALKGGGEEERGLVKTYARTTGNGGKDLKETFTSYFERVAWSYDKNTLIDLVLCFVKKAQSGRVFVKCRNCISPTIRREGGEGKRKGGREGESFAPVE